MYRRIVVPLDGSEIAVSALPQAKDLAHHYDAQLVIVRIAHWPRAIASPVNTPTSGINPPYGVVVEENVHEQRDDDEYVDGVVRTLRSEGYNATGVVFAGSPADGIVSVLEDGDMLVMTSHGHGGLRRFFMGGVALEVVKRATVPVLILRA